MSHKVNNKRDAGRALVLGPNGQPVTSVQPRNSVGFYPTPKYAGSEDYRPRSISGYYGIKGALPAYDRWEIMNYGKQLFSQLGHVAGAVLQKNSWSVGDGWDPVFVGRNEAWGEEASAWLREQWYPACNVRGEPYDFKTSLFLSGVAWDVDGDDLMILTETDSGFPQIMIIPCQRVGSARFDRFVVEGGRFDGARIYDGVIYDRRNRPIGYRVLAEAIDNNYQVGEATDYPAYSCHHMYEPEWSDQGRGISRFGRPMLDIMDAQDIDVFLKRGVKLDSSQGLIHYTESGEAEDGTETVTASQVLVNGHTQSSTQTDNVVPGREVQVKPINGGDITYLRANVGEKIESFASERPHPNTEAFVQRLERRIMLALGWSYDLLDLTAIGGAPSRVLKALAMRTVGDRQRNLKRRALRAVRYALCKAMKTGRLTPYYGKDNDGDMLKWDFEMPGEISVDTGNDEKADRENLKIGSTTLSIICAKKGLGKWQDLQVQSRREILGWAEQAEEIEKATKGKISFDKAFDLLSQRTPNGTPLIEEQEAPEPAPAPKPKTK